MHYGIRRAASPPTFTGNWLCPTWQSAEILSINAFHPASLSHRPDTQAKVLYDDTGLYFFFHCQDRYVRCTRTEHQSITSRDTAVEVYLQPRPDLGYLNFEANALGTMLSFYITDPTRTDPGIFKAKQILPARLMNQIRCHSSIKQPIPIELTEPLTWTLQYFLPNSIFENYIGPLAPASERRWKGNFFKCADESSHPHWSSWIPLGEELNFHDPAFFGPILFS